MFFNKNNHEKGFALVAAIGLTLVLTAVGAGSLINSKSETKYANQSVSDNLALEAAKSGVDIYFARINDATYVNEIKAIGSYSGTGIVVPTYGSLPSYYADLGVDNKSQLPSDAYIQANLSKFLIYSVTSQGVTLKTTWDNHPKYQQVAVWVETYDSGLKLTDYPYSRNGVSTRHHVTGTATAKKELSFVVYALGSYGADRKVVRNRIAMGSGYVRDLAAVNNAPRYNSNPALCTDSGKNEGKSGDSSHESTTSSAVTSYSSGTSFGDGLIIDSTQSYYTRGIKSNNAVMFPLDNNDGLFDYQDAVSSIVAGNLEPLVVYDEGKVNKVNYPKVTGSSIASNYANTVRSDLFGTSDYLDYFASSASSLFYLDAYREAANRMSGYPDGEVIAGYTVNVNSGGMGNASTLKSDNDDHARMGTLSWEDFQYNMENEVPMYGIVRVLVPTKKESESQREDHDNNICGNVNTDRFIPIVSYNGDNEEDKIEGGDGKIIVYGSLFFDFFEDKNEDLVYDLADDTLLTFSQAMTTDLQIDIPVMVNPVADGFTPINNGSTSDYTAVGFYQDGTPSNSLATDASSAGNGLVDYMAQLVGVSNNMNSQFFDNGTLSFKFNNYLDLLNGTNYNNADVLSLLDYYHQTRAFSSLANYSHVSLSDIGTNKPSFYIDTKSDKKTYAPSAADAFHVFMPSGYVHGWKRAFEVTGLASSDWNTGLVALDSPFAGLESEIFYLPNVGGKDSISKDFKDVPAIIQSAGILDLKGLLNVSGIVYNSGSIRLGLKDAPSSWQADPTYYLDSWLASKIADCNANESGSDLVDCINDANKDYNKKIAFINKEGSKIAEKCVGKNPGDRVEVDGKDIYCGSIKKSTEVYGQYISGATISGYGTFFEKDKDGEYIIISYDDVSTDNIPVGHDEMILRKTHWEEVK